MEVLPACNPLGLIFNTPKREFDIYLISIKLIVYV